MDYVEYHDELDDELFTTASDPCHCSPMMSRNVQAGGSSITTTPFERDDMSCLDSTRLVLNNERLKPETRRASLANIFAGGALKDSFSGLFKKRKQERSMSLDSSSMMTEDEKIARLVERMELEGRTEQDISHVMSNFPRRPDLTAIPEVASPTPSAPSTPTIGARPNKLTEVFKSLQAALRAEMQVRRPDPCITVHISSFAPPPTLDAAGNPLHHYQFFYYAPGQEPQLTYENLSNLEPVYNGVKNIDRFPIIEYTGQAMPGDQTTCAICLSDYEHGEVLRPIDCVHTFHKECIDRWLAVSQNCPVCKCHMEEK